MKGLLRLTAALGLSFLAACSSNPTYTYVQNEDGLAMKAPIRFSVRVKVDKSKRTVGWVQDALDANGVSDRQIRTYGEAPFSPCHIFDEANWYCEISTAGKLAERPEMREGELSRFYWTKVETYTKSNLISSLRAH